MHRMKAQHTSRRAAWHAARRQELPNASTLSRRPSIRDEPPTVRPGNCSGLDRWSEIPRYEAEGIVPLVAINKGLQMLLCAPLYSIENTCAPAFMNRLLTERF